MMNKINKWIEKIKWRWWLANHEHDWEYRSGVCGVDINRGAWTEKFCKDPKCRQVEKIYI